MRRERASWTSKLSAKKFFTVGIALLAIVVTFILVQGQDKLWDVFDKGTGRDYRAN